MFEAMTRVIGRIFHFRVKGGTRVDLKPCTQEPACQNSGGKPEYCLAGFLQISGSQSKLGMGTLQDELVKLLT